MPNNRSLMMTLLHLEGLLMNHPTFLHGSGVGVDDPEFQKNRDELVNVSKHLKVICREIQQKRDALRVRQTKAKQSTLAGAFRATSSAKTQSNELDDLLELSSRLNNDLRKLITRNNLMSKVDALGQLASQIHDTGENAQELRALIEDPKGELFITTPHAEPGIQGIILPLIVSLVTFIHLIEKRKH